MSTIKNIKTNVLGYPRIGKKRELKKTERYIDKENLWVNPDCGLKTRGWTETKASLIRMVEAAKELRK